MKQAVPVANFRRPQNQSAKGIYISGEPVALTMKDMIPKHDAALGVFYLEAAPVKGRRWKPLHGARTTLTGETASGPGWFELLDPSEEPPED